MNNFMDEIDFNEPLIIDGKELFLIVNMLEYSKARRYDDLLRTIMEWNGIDASWNDETVERLSSKLKALTDKFYEDSYYR